MKCLILAGGKGDRLWPLSRKNYPKQFIGLQKNHSIFQETVARNLAFCDEFIISTSSDYQYIVENQMQAFPGISYRCILEEEGRKTTAAIVLACMEMEPSELIFVVSSDQLISGEEYKENILKAREYAQNGSLVVFGMTIGKPDNRFGYIKFDGENVLEFVEKPDEETLIRYVESGDYLINSGLFLFRNDSFLYEVKIYAKDIYQECVQQYKFRKYLKGHILYKAEQLEQISAMAIEKAVFEKTQKAVVVHAGFDWKDIGTFEDLYATDSGIEDFGQKMLHECSNVSVINQQADSVVIADGLYDLTIVNTKDAVYVGKKGNYDTLKLFSKEEVLGKYFENGGVTYRAWGTHEVLTETSGYRVRRVVIKSGKTIYNHKHEQITEQWAIVQGEARILQNGKQKVYGSGDVLTIKAGTFHQISNIGNHTLIMIETTLGENICVGDIVSGQSVDLTDKELGFHIEPYVRLLPTFKDYLWGGVRLRDDFGKSCDYDIIAESWEMSAHPAGQSIVNSGRYKGMHFGNYLQNLGKELWGWKCKANSEFPILIKFIDAKKDLSIQVHPDDEYALEKDNEYGKNEMWYIIDSEEGAGLYCGFKEDITREEVEKRIYDNTLTEVLNWVETKPGDVFFIPAGTVHAIGAGNLICEVQQNSNSTYRLYDYGRRNKFGELRELHLEKALDVLSYQRYIPQQFTEEKYATEGYEKKLITECKYFTCQEFTITTEVVFSQEETSFMAIVCIGGIGQVVSESYCDEIKMGDTFFIPAGNKEMKIEGTCKILLVRV